MNRDERIVRVLLGARAEAVPDRLLVVSSSFVKTRASSKLTRTRISGKLTTGDFEGKVVGIVDVGVGTPSTSMIMEAIVRTKPILIVRSEICGGLSAEHNIGDIFVATSAIVGDGAGNSYFGFESIVSSHSGVADYAIELLQNRGVKVHCGPIWTTDVLMKQSPEILKDWIGKGALAVDMESSAILGIAELEGIPATSLNCISDLPFHGPKLFDSECVDPNFISGTDIVIEEGLRTLVSWLPS